MANEVEVTVQEVLNASAVLAVIVNDGAKRDIPPKGKYWLSRLARALEKEAATAQERQLETIRKYGEEVFGDPTEEQIKADPNAKGPSLGWKVRENDEDRKAYKAEWEPIAKEVIKVACQPIPLAALVWPDEHYLKDQDKKNIDVDEFIRLGAFVTAE